ncbi:uncharacterized protein RJT20DRAFT_124006 [Scheffersomyces xylosifermentans]|uniref:uncharacterized protein n=1 Tax=Scheffersomyces xylosifermentans TaxID=1304137 RepID=UPI00315DC252
MLPGRVSQRLLRIASLSRGKMTSSAWKPRYFDIGVNFSDSMFQGYYNGSKTPKHPTDIDKVIDRAHLFNVSRMLITASSIKESEEHFALCEEYSNNFSSTAGVHPCTVAQEFYIKDEVTGVYTEELRNDVDERLNKLKSIVEEGHSKGYTKAFGEIGLDYDRLHYSSVAQQKTMFRKQLEVIAKLKHIKLPLFLHMRSACDDFIDIIKPFIDDGSIEKGNGVVHSFTGSEEELQKLLDLGFYIGINGCSLKTEENLKVAALVPKEKLMIETDAPWCEIRKSHASYQYITSYPNKFYPEIPSPTHLPSESEFVSDLSSQVDSSDVETKPKKKKKQQQQPKQKQPDIKLDDFLPFPTIKKENFQKHNAISQSLIESHVNPDSINYQVGQFAYPLMKSRNEPVFVGYVAEILCALHGITEEKEIEQFIDLIFENSCKLFKV